MTPIDSTIKDSIAAAESEMATATAAVQEAMERKEATEQTLATLRSQEALLALVGEFHRLLIIFGDELDETNEDMRQIEIEDKCLAIDARAKKKADSAVEIEFTASDSHWHNEPFRDSSENKWATPQGRLVMDEQLKATYVRPPSSAELTIIHHTYEQQTHGTSLDTFIATLSAKLKEWTDKGPPKKEKDTH